MDFLYTFIWNENAAKHLLAGARVETVEALASNQQNLKP